MGLDAKDQLGLQPGKIKSRTRYPATPTNTITFGGGGISSGSIAVAAAVAIVAAMAVAVVVSAVIVVTVVAAKVAPLLSLFSSPVVLVVAKAELVAVSVPTDSFFFSFFLFGTITGEQND